MMYWNLDYSVFGFVHQTLFLKHTTFRKLALPVLKYLK